MSLQQDISHKTVAEFQNLCSNLPLGNSSVAIDKLLQTFLKVSEYEINDFRQQLHDSLKELPSCFYTKYASIISDEITQEPLKWFTTIQGELELFTKENLSTVKNTLSDISKDSYATCLVRVLISLINNDLAQQIFWAQQIEHYISRYYLAEAYRAMGNYANAIKSVNSFLTQLNEDAEQDLENDFREINNIKFILLQESLFLTYLHVMEKNYNKAIKEFETILKTYSTKFLYEVFGKVEVGSQESEFAMHIHNYSIALDQINEVNLALNKVDTALKLAGNSKLLRSRKKYLTNRLKKMEDKERPAPYLKTKRAFNIESFRETQLLSREKILEDMIEEQIKYGYKVFDKKLEVFDSSSIRGRQYILQNNAGILDLLLHDKEANVLYVVELKRNKAGKDVYHQIKRYMEGISLEVDMEVRGIICLHQPQDELVKLVKKESDIELFTYHFDFKKLA